MDAFRLIAAILVIAIHTSPLSDINSTADFILTRIIARIAVPFFFMTSGFFLYKDGMDKEKLKKFLKSTAVLYAVSIILYLPINIYSGYFGTDMLLPNILKDLVFDGTFYHLWYLPAALLGGFITWLLIDKLGYKRAIIIALALYVIGLLGDSYYGLTAQVPALLCSYEHMFDLFDYTRNGLFFAPVFFAAGALAGHIRLSRLKSALIACGAFAFMLFEGLILRRVQYQRHDSMYIMLLPCVFFLFILLMDMRGKRPKLLRDMSVFIYILHPLVIIALRGAARLFNFREPLLGNSLIYFVFVAVVSIAAAYILAVIKRWSNLIIKKRPPNQTPKNFPFIFNGRSNHTKDFNTGRAWMEISLNRLKNNTLELLNALPHGCKLMAVVKANAYGLGAYEIALFLNHMGIDSFAVSTLDEGISLRKKGITGEILILGYTDTMRAFELHRYNLTQTALDYPYALALNNMGYKLKVHAAVDTGMKRLGVQPQNKEELLELFKLPNLTVTGIYSHLCVSFSSKEADRDFTLFQIKRFDQMLEYLKSSGIKLPRTHLQSSYGLLNYPELNYSLVRAAALLFGILDYPDTVLKPKLEPIISLKARIALIKRIKTGETVGYGREFIAQRDTVIAVIPIGYADGIPDSLSCGTGQGLVLGRRVSIAGRICMDQMMLDVTDVPQVCRGDVVTFIGPDGSEYISPTEMAQRAGISVNELVSRLGSRLDRLYIN